MTDNISIISLRKNLFDLQLNHSVARVSYLMHKEVKPIYAEPRHKDNKHFFASFNKIQHEISFSHKADFNIGIRMTLTRVQILIN